MTSEGESKCVRGSRVLLVGVGGGHGVCSCQQGILGSVWWGVAILATRCWQHAGWLSQGLGRCRKMKLPTPAICRKIKQLTLAISCPEKRKRSCAESPQPFRSKFRCVSCSNRCFCPEPARDLCQRNRGGYRPPFWRTPVGPVRCLHLTFDE